MDKITTNRTSRHSANVEEPFVLEEKDNTRRIFKAIINDAKKESGETVSGTIIHQRKTKAQTWVDCDSFNQATLKAGEEIKLYLGSTQTKNLFDALTQLYEVSNDGLNPGRTEFTTARADEVIKVPKERKLIIERLLEQEYAEEVWEELVKSNPNLATRLSMARIQEDRLKALDEFESSLEQDLNEDYWQEFFSKNQWIFGYGLNYQFLSQITDQPKYGGQNLEGKGTQKGDFLMNSEAIVKYTVLVEIKKPSTKLFSYKSGEVVKYRNGAILLSGELIGGTTQIQANARTWAFHSKLPDKIIEGIESVEPKGILIIGHTQELSNKDMIETFEGFRKSLTHPKILTYDELFQRAKYIVQKNDELVKESINETEDELPF